jgi:hypothetical protein
VAADDPISPPDPWCGHIAPAAAGLLYEFLICSINDTKIRQTALAPGRAAGYLCAPAIGPPRSFGFWPLWPKTATHKLFLKKQLTFTADTQQSLAFEHYAALDRDN